jgi:TRAP-type C4-dicarboxylate transport system substrate-binding protein
MFKLKRFIQIGVIVTTLLSGAAAANDSIVLRYNQWFPSKHWSQVDGLYPYFEEVEKVTEGRVKIQPSAKPIVPPTKNYQAVVSGIVDVAWGPHGYAPGVFPLSEMVEFPFSVDNAGNSSKAYWRVFEKFFKPAGMHKEVVTLGVHVTSGGNIHMKNIPIRKLSDIEGKKIRVQTNVVGSALKSLGGVPVSGSLSELREFLSRGIVDGTTLSDELLTGFKVDKYVEHVTQIPGGLYSSSAFIIINKDKWDLISTEDQQAILAISGEKLSTNMGDLWHKNDVAARKLLETKLGDNYRVADPALLAGLNNAFAPLMLEWSEKASDLGVNGEEALKFYKAETKAASMEMNAQ